MTYYLLTFAISWGGVLALIGPGGLPARPDQRMTIGLVMLAGPSLAGLLMAGMLSGRAGLSEMLVRLRRWRVSWRWYAVALPTAPLTPGRIPPVDGVGIRPNREPARGGPDARESRCNPQLIVQPPTSTDASLMSVLGWAGVLWLVVAAPERRVSVVAMSTANLGCTFNRTSADCNLGRYGLA